jgi:hypothetical protein
MLRKSVMKGGGSRRGDVFYAMSEQSKDKMVADVIVATGGQGHNPGGDSAGADGHRSWRRSMSGLADSAVQGDYTDPVRPLLTLGKDSAFRPDKWPDYPKRFGLEEEHIGALLRMASDPALLDGDADPVEAWAPVHAWRALGQLRAEAAVAPLLDLLKMALEDDDAAASDLPVVFGMIGAPALPLLGGFLADRTNSEYPVATVISGVSAIGQRCPECRDECVGILVRMLDPAVPIDPSTGGFVVCALLDLAAVEAIDAIRDAFARGAIESSIPGDLEDVEIALGLRTKRATPRPHYGLQAAGLGALASLPEDDRFGHDVLPRRQAVGRNDPCPCGSGKKYKKCCLAA